MNQIILVTRLYSYFTNVRQNVVLSSREMKCVDIITLFIL